jgi:hypothetical protein
MEQEKKQFPRGHAFPVDHPLAGCEAKLVRAQQNLKVLDDEIGNFLDSHNEPIPRVSQLDPQTNRRVRWVIGSVDEPDLTLAAVIGDYIHDLRSTLDHLAFELSFRDTGGVIPNRQIAFPCCHTRNEWHGKRTQAKLYGINKTHRAMIYRAQPCYRRKDAPASPRAVDRRRRSALADLEEFWNHDKHRTLQPVASAPFHVHGEIIDIRDCVPTGSLHLEKSIFGRPLTEDTQVFWMPVRPTGPNPEVEMDFQVAVRITFRNGLPALDTLVSLGNWVGNVIEYFAPQFEDRKARRLWGAPRRGWIEDVPIRMRTRLYTTQRAGDHSSVPEGN